MSPKGPKRNPKANPPQPLRPLFDIIIAAAMPNRIQMSIRISTPHPPVGFENDGAERPECLAASRFQMRRAEASTHESTVDAARDACLHHDLSCEVAHPSPTSGPRCSNSSSLCGQACPGAISERGSRPPLELESR